MLYFIYGKPPFVVILLWNCVIQNAAKPKIEVLTAERRIQICLVQIIRSFIHENQLTWSAERPKYWNTVLIQHSFVKTYTAETFLLFSISKCYNKFWCIVTQPVICTSALTELHNWGHAFSELLIHYLSTTTTKPFCCLHSMANPHDDDDDDTEFFDTQSSGVVDNVLALHMN